MVDGFRAAVEMRERWPELFEVLRSVGVPWHASGNDDASITPDRRYPVIETLGGAADAPIHRVRWNNDDRGVVDPAVAPRWYEAARKWDALLKDSANEFWFQLTPGTVLSTSIRPCDHSYSLADHLLLQYSTTGAFSMAGVLLKASGVSVAVIVRYNDHTPSPQSWLTFDSQPRRLPLSVEDLMLLPRGD